MPEKNIYVCQLNSSQSEQLRALLESGGWELGTAPYARWKAKKGKLSIVSYDSGKLTVQGKETGDFVRFTLEPEILKEVRYGYETQIAEMEDPAMFQPHAGIDESGKGDYFGPLVVACCYTDADTARHLLDAGVADSKTIKSDAKIKALDAVVRKECAGRFNVLTVRPETYNRLYDSFGNLNRLLAWGHAKALENLLELVPDCPRAISDQFAKSGETVRRALQTRGRQITLEQHPKAEADVAVAAASILARAAFVRMLDKLSQDAGKTLPKGGGPAVKATAAAVMKEGGKEGLGKIAKLHFKITEEAE